VDEAQKLMKDMLSAMSYLHANGVVHRDLKLENFIFSGPGPGEGKIKLIDFGLSRVALENEVMTTDVGSVVFKAPEVMNGNYSEASDLWSLGVICHMLVTGIVPWEGSTRAEIEGSIRKEVSNTAGFIGYLTWFYESMKVSADCADFIMGLLTVDVEQRMTCDTARQHAWMGGNFASRDRNSRKSIRKTKLSAAMASKLKGFRNQSKLTRTALLAISFSVGPEELEALGNAFSEVDKDGDGLISREDFNKLMKKHGVYVAS
jgi:calcium-dependent protein kinase